ncbi:phosphoglycerate dehydrogenase [Oleispirillum naphthae]|uniref:phosphoglycerate dehydrogenase n=1 Tax=Oleispirillum naphthae TaxID=2838853 RepID=UPI00308220CE
MSKLSLPKEKIKVVLLEGIHDNAVHALDVAGYTNVDSYPGALDDTALREAIADAHIVGIRSRTRLTAPVIAAAPKLMGIGCFCIGTNQVDLRAAKMAGIPVFNAPYSNTRSVAELVLGEMIMLYRGVPEKTTAAHAGRWLKSAKGSHEVRGKKLGIVGYGHIGSQLSILAEALGLEVQYFDVVNKLALGNARACPSLEQLLETSDIVTLHVPATEQTKGMIGPSQIGAMKKGAILINASRGNVVDIEALAAALSSGALSGAAIDVFPAEPPSNDAEFVSPLRGMANVILTPHIGGSTQEAQANIGTEVADKLITYSDNGSTLGAVNFMEVALPVQGSATRFMHIHRNVPGVISRINDIFSGKGINIAGQYLRTDGEIGYVVVDVEADIRPGMGFRKALDAIDGTIRSRFLF